MARRDFKVVDPQAGKDAPALPNNVEVEQQLLGALMLNNEAYGRVAHLVDAEDFYDGIHRQIYEVVAYMVGEGRVANPATMKSHLAEIDMGDLGMTAQAYAALLCGEATTVLNCPDYATIIKDLAVRRRAYVFYEGQMKRILKQDPRDTSIAIVDDAEEFVGKVRPVGQRTEQFIPFAKAVARATQSAEAAYQRGAVISGMSTGLVAVDNGLGGLNRGELIVVAGRPGMGKTALAVNIAFNVAKDLIERRLDNQKTGVVGFFSLEMPSEQLAARIMAESSKVASHKIRGGKVNEAEIQRFIESGRNLSNLPIHIDQTGALPISSLMMRARSLKKRHGVELIIVDYLQLLKGSNSGHREVNRVQELTEITGSLKALAKDLDVPVVALSQLSREVDKRDDKRPKLSDLRESGSIEQDADSVVFCYREDYYLKHEIPPAGSERYAEWKMKLDDAWGHAELIIGKNRHGPTTTLNVGYNPELMQFHNDPPERVASAPKGEKGQKPKALNLPGKATAAWGVLRGMVLGDGVPNHSENGLLVTKAPKDARLVKYLLWRKRCAEEILDPGAKESEAIKIVQDAAIALTNAGLIKRGGDKDDPYCWIVGEK